MKQKIGKGDSPWKIVATGFCHCMGTGGYHRTAEFRNGDSVAIVHVNKALHDPKCSCRDATMYIQDESVDPTVVF